MKRRPRILVVGSLVMDLTVTTKVFPHSGETVLGISFQSAPGGKGSNQAVQAAKLGADVTMVGCVGQDFYGEALLRSAKEHGVDTAHIQIRSTAPTATGTIILEEDQTGSTQNRIIVVPGANMEWSPADIEFLRSTIQEYDLVLLQLEIPMEINQQVAEMAHRAHVPVMLNPAPAAPIPDALLSCLTYLSPNEHEAAAISGSSIRKDNPALMEQDILAVWHYFQEKGIQNLLVTLGDYGAAIVNEESGVQLSPAVPDVRAADPTAAGDSFIGAFCTARSCGMALAPALAFANRTAAITVSRKGAQPSLPSREEVLGTIAENSPLSKQLPEAWNTARSIHS